MTVLQVPPAFAAKTVWDVFGTMFEEKQQEPDPSQTLQAPFAYDPARTVETDEALPENSIPLNLSHRSPKEIGDWLMTAVSDSLSFEIPADGSKPLLKTEYFTASGFHQFEEFLKQTGIQKVLDSRKYNLRSFVRNTPLLLNQGSVQGHYRWLFEVPVMVSYIETGDFKYGGVDKTRKDPINQELTLTLQVSRVKEGGGKDGVLIEIWNGKIEALEKKK
ncbi:MAG: DotI/IcmL family type IV secretion protein [Alphaproteobacteria bacterium]|nr:DotI/IcmL family type IV secretion protein [Alphaproteobacteria bacterium]